MAWQARHGRNDDEYWRLLPGQLDQLWPLVCRRFSCLALPTRISIYLSLHLVDHNSLASGISTVCPNDYVNYVRISNIVLDGF